MPYFQLLSIYLLIIINMVFLLALMCFFLNIGKKLKAIKLNMENKLPQGAVVRLSRSNEPL